MSPIRFGYLYPPDRQRPIRPGLHAPVQVEQALFQPFRVQHHVMPSTPAAASRFSAWKAQRSASGVT